MYLDEIYDRAGLDMSKYIPPLRQQVVLNALDRESKREDAIFIKKILRIHDGGRWIRFFTLKGDK